MDPIHHMAPTWLWVSLMLPVVAPLVSSLAVDSETTMIGATLQADELCATTGGEEGGCALSAMQLRSRRTRGGSHNEATQNSTNRIVGHPSPSTVYPTRSGFTLMLVEEFDAPIDLDSDPIWTWSDGGLLEGQVRFVKEAIKFEGGKMKIELGHSGGGDVQACSNAEGSVIPAKRLNSGEMRTRYNMFRYGLYEVRMKAPSVQNGNTRINGNFVATFFVFRDGKYKHWREIDFEITGDAAGSLQTNILSADNTEKWNWRIQEDAKHALPFNVREDFHTYAFEWLPHRITWYVDGKVIRVKEGGKLPIPEMSGKVMMNLWTFNEPVTFGGKQIWNDRYPMHTEYDWFRFYKWNGDQLYPCASMDGQCLTDDDKYLSSNNPCDGIPQVGSILGRMPCHATCR